MSQTRADIANMTASLAPLTDTQFFNSPVVPSAAIQLENGDRLTRLEFLRRWEAMPKLKRAELIEGIVYMAAAVRVPQHARPHGWLFNVLSTYAMHTGVDFGDNATVQLDPDNAPQPDICLFLPSPLGGKAKINDDGYLEGPPELIAEVAASSASIDLHAKFQVYRRHGVREYIVWRVLEQALDWFLLRDEVYVSHVLEDGRFKSVVFPGLWLDPVALMAFNSERLHAALDEGMASPEYLKFRVQVQPFAPKPT
jgi:Uma2 family endonuclease